MVLLVFCTCVACGTSRSILKFAKGLGDLGTLLSCISGSVHVTHGGVSRNSARGVLIRKKARDTAREIFLHPAGAHAQLRVL